MKTKSYIFWIRSSKGTDSQKIVELDGSLKKEDIKAELETWCSFFGAGKLEKKAGELSGFTHISVNSWCGGTWA